ncbi:MAG: Lrp/AsnC ligand binding domain-containing protein [Thaumarchaeota archaeon]|nr:Lrp/AsnC ligand binding domain-containing protein [Nitrososphaerota archaeon]MBI3641655.1 Lrp/AsnC ligand binding domain-containing protein [Nitrososphaerota archaeon]
MSESYVAIHCDVGHELDVIHNLKKVSKINEIQGVLGLYDVICKVEADNTQELENIIITKIRKIRHVQTTMSLLVAQ